MSYLTEVRGSGIVYRHSIHYSKKTYVCNISYANTNPYLILRQLRIITHQVGFYSYLNVNNESLFPLVFIKYSMTLSFLEIIVS